MPFLKSVISRLSRKSTPVVANNMPLVACCYQLRSQIEPTRFVRKVEICSALAGESDTTHHHTLLRVFLEPTPKSAGDSVSEDVLLVERVLYRAGEYHSVTPIGKTTLLSSYTDVHDRICIVSEGPSTSLARDLEVERTLTFGSSGPLSEKHRIRPRSRHHRPLALAQFAQILDFVSRHSARVCSGGDCRLQSRSFAFMCVAAMAPRLPPPVAVGKASGEMGVYVTEKAEEEDVVVVVKGGVVMDDAMIELGAEAFLSQVSWLVKDATSIQTLELIHELKEESQCTKVKARLYH